MPVSSSDRKHDVEGRARPAAPAMRCQCGRRVKERAQLLGRHRPLALIEHLDVAAEGNGGDDIFRAVGRPTRFQIALPKPTEKRSTLKPSRRATQKWPNSCTVTSRQKATRKASSRSEASAGKRSCVGALAGATPRDGLGRQGPRLAIGRQNRIQSCHRSPSHPAHDRSQ